MRPQFDLRILRPLSRKSLSGKPPNATLGSASSMSTRGAVKQFRLSIGPPVLALLGIAMAGSVAVAQQPAPIPNWSTADPGTTQGQYAQDPQQQNGQQPPDYDQQANPQQQLTYNDPTQSFAAPYQPAQALTPDRLEQMVAPIALYPDNLVSMVLAGSTYPAQVVAADQWLHTQGGAPPQQIAAGADAQAGWDPSVKALTGFPQVLDQMAQNLQWTTDLGNAYYNQPQDVLQTVQVMRDRAQQAGNLQNTPQQEVIEDQGNIQIAPPTPQVVYVPQYNPWVVYGEPLVPYPGFHFFGAIGSAIDGAIFWGPAIALDVVTFPFRWLGWGLDWYSHAIFFGGDVWCTHSHEMHDWGFAHGGGRYWGARGELAYYHNRGGWGGRGGYGGERGGYAHTFRSGFDRGNFPNAIHPSPRGFNGAGNDARGNQGNYGNRNGGFGQRPGAPVAGQNGNNFARGGNTYGSEPNRGFGQRPGSPVAGQNGSNFAGGGNTYGGQPNRGFGQRPGSPVAGQNGSNSARGGNTYGGQPNSGFGQRPGSPVAGQNGTNFARGGNTYNGYGSSIRGPQPTGRPQQYGGNQQYAPGRSGAYGGGQQAYGGAYSNRQSYGYSSGGSNRPLQNYGMRPGFGGSNAQPYRPPASPGYSAGAGNRSYGFAGSSPRTYSGSRSYGGSGMYGGSNIARAPSGGGYSFGGSRGSNSYGYGGGESFKAPKAPSFGGGGGRSFWGGGGGGGFKAPSAPHFSGGGGSHFGGGGGSHFSSGGGGGHFGGGGHSGGGGHFGGVKHR